MFSHPNRHPLGMEDHDRIDQRASESAENGAAAHDPLAQLFELAGLAGLDKVAAERKPPQPQEMREEVKPQCKGYRCTGIPRTEFLPYPSLECLL